MENSNATNTKKVVCAICGEDMLLHNDVMHMPALHLTRDFARAHKFQSIACPSVCSDCFYEMK